MIDFAQTRSRSEPHRRPRPRLRLPHDRGQAFRSETPRLQSDLQLRRQPMKLRTYATHGRTLGVVIGISLFAAACTASGGAHGAGEIINPIGPNLPWSFELGENGDRSGGVSGLTPHPRATRAAVVATCSLRKEAAKRQLTARQSARSSTTSSEAWSRRTIRLERKTSPTRSWSRRSRMSKRRCVSMRSSPQVSVLQSLAT
jgi:hypothetical protein